jgi:putative redox protein
MVEMQVEYQGGLHCRATHGPSGTVISTDAPADNQGRGESFSPTDLLATSVGVCMMTIMGIRARNQGIELQGARARVEKGMAADPKRRVGRVGLTFEMPAGVAPAERAGFEEAARTCPVALSIHPRIELDVTFRWGESDQ